MKFIANNRQYYQDIESILNCQSGQGGRAGLFHSRLKIPDCIYRKPFLAIPSRIFRNFRFPI
ncbi:MAG TPA: hypothetical protein DEA78_26220, partial [Cyanobacteria bacterium UBA11159]|nr:hypothetical protein [Cyanobacteria bacterium UBA11159]